MKLDKCTWFKNVYVRIYQILALEDRLPKPEEIEVFEKPPAEPRETVYGQAYKNTNAVWFRTVPPADWLFAHELIHLVKDKKTEELEEIYAYNLSNFIAILARKGIIPPANPVRLYDEVTLEMVLETLREVYHYPFKNIVEYFTTRGVIPLFLKEASPEKIQEILKTKGRLDPEDMFEIDPKYDERTITQHTLTEILAEAEYEKSALKVLLKLLETLAKH
jgi:hypothetical protein